MPANPIHDILDAGLRWLGGDSKANERRKKGWEEEDQTMESLKLHQAARAGGLESDSEDENFNTNKPKKYRKEGKYDPPTDLSVPFGSPFGAEASMRYNATTTSSSPPGLSTSGATIGYGATDGYQRSIWQKEGVQASKHRYISSQASPRATGTSRTNSEEPNSDRSRSEKQRGEKIPPPHSTQGNYIAPPKSSGKSQVASPRSSDTIPAGLPTRNFSPQDRTPTDGRVYLGNDKYSTNHQGSSHANRPPSRPQTSFDPVRDAACRNAVAAGAGMYRDSRPSSSTAPACSSDIGLDPPTTPHTIPARRPVLSFASSSQQRQQQQPSTKRKEKDTSDSPISEADQAKLRHQNEDQAARERQERNLQKSQQENQKTSQQLPSPIPPKLPLSQTKRPPLAPSTNPTTSPKSSTSPIGIPLIPPPPISDFKPNNSWPGQINSPPYPLSRPIGPPPLLLPQSRRNSVASSAWQNNLNTNISSSPPYPVTPANYHLNGYNNQNSIQSRAIHHAIKDTVRNGHTRKAGPTPPTWKRDYPRAMELECGDGRGPAKHSKPSDDTPRTKQRDRVERIEIPAARERVKGINVQMPVPIATRPRPRPRPRLAADIGRSLAPGSPYNSLPTRPNSLPTHPSPLPLRSIHKLPDRDHTEGIDRIPRRDIMGEEGRRAEYNRIRGGYEERKIESEARRREFEKKRGQLERMRVGLVMPEIRVQDATPGTSLRGLNGEGRDARGGGLLDVLGRERGHGHGHAHCKKNGDGVCLGA